MPTSNDTIPLPTMNGSSSPIMNGSSRPDSPQQQRPGDLYSPSNVDHINSSGFLTNGFSLPLYETSAIYQPSSVSPVHQHIHSPSDSNMTTPSSTHTGGQGSIRNRQHPASASSLPEKLPLDWFYQYAQLQAHIYHERQLHRQEVESLRAELSHLQAQLARHDSGYGSTGAIFGGKENDKVFPDEDTIRQSRQSLERIREPSLVDPLQHTGTSHGSIFGGRIDYNTASMASHGGYTATSEQSQASHHYAAGSFQQGPFHLSGYQYPAGSAQFHPSSYQWPAARTQPGHNAAFDQPAYYYGASPAQSGQATAQHYASPPLPTTATSAPIAIPFPHPFPNQNTNTMTTAQPYYGPPMPGYVMESDSPIGNVAIAPPVSDEIVNPPTTALGQTPMPGGANQHRFYQQVGRPGRDRRSSDVRQAEASSAAVRPNRASLDSLNVRMWPEHIIIETSGVEERTGQSGEDVPNDSNSEDLEVDEDGDRGQNVAGDPALTGPLMLPPRPSGHPGSPSQVFLSGVIQRLTGDAAPTVMQRRSSSEEDDAPLEMANTSPKPVALVSGSSVGSPSRGGVETLELGSGNLAAGNVSRGKERAVASRDVKDEEVIKEPEGLKLRTEVSSNFGAPLGSLGDMGRKAG